MNIYLACTVRGDRGALGVARALADAIASMGHAILTSHLLADDPDAAESRLTERAVFERDLAWLESADVLIAEASGSSYGVGFEVGYVTGRAAQTGQRVLLLYDAAARSRVSRLIVGHTHPACTTYAYRDAADLVAFVEGFLSQCGTVGRLDDAISPLRRTRRGIAVRGNPPLPT
jgi:nucleoside 2-deoxyribosyltransferase